MTILQDPLALVAFVCLSTLVLMLSLLLRPSQEKVHTRLEELAQRPDIKKADELLERLSQSMLPKLGAPLMPKSKKDRNDLETRLAHAGLYDHRAVLVFLGIKMVLILVPLAIGALLLVSGMRPAYAALAAMMGSAIGMLLPSFWLARKTAKRQRLLRAALPDALDMVVICLEGGMSLQGALQRVTEELGAVHPLLAFEWSLNQRAIQLGRSPGQALQDFAERSGLEEMQSMAAVIIQSDRMGAGTARALSVHAEKMREKRLQKIEEQAQTAAVKLIFPLLLCIFPAIFIVVLGPAAAQLAGLMK